MSLLFKTINCCLQVLFPRAFLLMLISIQSNQLLGVPKVKPFPGLVLIESTYLDDSVKTLDKKVTVRGMGILLKSTQLSKKETYFVISVSHLTQGQNLKMRLMSQPGIELTPISSKHRLADNDQDLEIIEIQKPNEEKLEFFSDEHCENYNFRFLYPFDISIQSNQRDIHHLNSYRKNLLWLTDSLFIPIPEFSVGERSRILDSPLKPNFVLNFQDLYLIPEEAPVSFKWLAIDNKISPGMSGSPLIEKIKESEGRYVLIGIARAYSRFFNKSIYASGNNIEELITYYNGYSSFHSNIPKQRGFFKHYENPESDLIRWKYSKTIGFYRDYGNGLLEANIETNQASSFDLNESGGGDLSDGGIITNNLVHDNEAGIGMRLNNQTIIGFKTFRFESFERDKYNSSEEWNFTNYDILNQNRLAYGPYYTIFANHLGKVAVEKLSKDNDNNDENKKMSHIENVELNYKNLNSLFLERFNTAVYVDDSEINSSPCLIDSTAYSRESKIRLRIDSSDKKGNFKIIELNKDDLQPNKFSPFISSINSKPISIIGLFMVNIMEISEPLEAPLGWISPILFHKSESLVERILPMMTRYPYVYYARAPGTAASPTFCSKTNKSSLFQTQAH